MLDFFSIRTVLLIVFTAIALSQPSFATTYVEPWYQPSKQHADPLYDDATLQKMEAVHLSIRWENVSLKDALEELAARSKKADSAHVGIRFISEAPLNAKKVSLTVTDTALLNILGYLSQQAGFEVKIHRGEVIIVPVKGV